MASLVDITINRSAESEPLAEDVNADPGLGSPPAPAGEDRRLQVRAYNFWLRSITDGELPLIESLSPAELGEIGTHGVLFDLTMGVSSPVIVHIGSAIASECAGGQDLFTLRDVPAGSLLSQVTDHCLDAAASRAPVGFEAAYTAPDGRNVLYRSIVLPFSSDGEAVDFAYGVINWKHGEQTAAMPAPEASSTKEKERKTSSLQELLTIARAAADELCASERRSRKALYRAIGATYDLALTAERQSGGLASFLATAGMIDALRSEFTALARLVFGAGYDPTRLAEVACVLRSARRRSVAQGDLPNLLATTDGGLKAWVSEERTNARQLRAKHAPSPSAALLRKLAVKAPGGFDHADRPGNEFFVVIARRRLGGNPVIIGATADQRLVSAAARRLIPG